MKLKKKNVLGENISLDEFRPAPSANSNINVEQGIMFKEGVKNAKLDPRNVSRDEGTIDMPHPQSMVSKAWEVALHPVTAMTNLSKQGRIPDNFSKGDTNPFEYAADVFNPVFYLNAAGKTVKNLVSPETYSDIPKTISSAVINLAGEQSPDEWNAAGLRTLGRAGDALTSLPVVGAATIGGIKGFTQVAKKSPAVREIIYKGIDPLGYGAREKITNFIPNLVKYSINPEAKLAGATKQFKGLGLLDSDAEQFAKNRMDAWRVGLNLDQKYNTFAKIGENKYTFNPGVMEPSKYTLSDVHSDALANIITKGRSNNRKYRPTSTEIAQLKDLTRSKDIRIGEAPADMTRNYDTHQQNMLVDNFNKDFTTSVYDSDRYTGTMGTFRWDLNHTSDGLHFQANDTWDLHPFATRGNYSTRGYAPQAASKHLYESLKNVEMLDVLGGKPFDIQTNFLVDPKNYKVLKQFENGGRQFDNLPQLFTDGGEDEDIVKKEINWAEKQRELENSKGLYEPGQSVKNLKAVISGLQFSPNPLINLGARIEGTVADATTAALYALSGQPGKASIDAGQALLNWAPGAKGEKIAKASDVETIGEAFNWEHRPSIEQPKQELAPVDNTYVERISKTGREFKYKKYR